MLTNVGGGVSNDPWGRKGGAEQKVTQCCLKVWKRLSSLSSLLSL